MLNPRALVTVYTLAHAAVVGAAARQRNTPTSRPTVHPRPALIHMASQVQLWSGLQHSTVVGIITAIAAYNVIAGLGPWSPTFSSENLRVRPSYLTRERFRSVAINPHQGKSGNVTGAVDNHDAQLWEGDQGQGQGQGQGQQLSGLQQ